MRLQGNGLFPQTSNRSSISQITIYVTDSMYTLNTVIYNGGVTY